MKCPKCEYLGFETGDRCKNCGYDFSLSFGSQAESEYDQGRSPGDIELSLQLHADEDVSIETPDPWITRDDEPVIQFESGADEAPEPIAEPTATPASLAAHVIAPMSGGVRVADTPFPLFTPADDDDEPLIKLPVAPRPPIAVRRTPDTPRLRAVPRASARPTPAPALQFSEDEKEQAPARERALVGSIAAHATTPGARLTAALIDHGILLGVDVAVIYFTLRIAGLAADEWAILPIAPMLTFLALLKVSYFYAFTAVGGQTIGKMSVGACVVGADGARVDAGGAMRRTCAGAVSFLLLGLGFLPALFGDGRALHDRLARTRVVRLRSI